MRKRKSGTGTITFDRGVYRPRMPRCMGRKPLDPQPSYEAAERILDAAIAVHQADGILPTDGDTWATVAHRWFESLPNKARLSRSYGGAVGRVSKDAWTRLPIDTIARRDLLLWLDARFTQWSDGDGYSRNTTALDMSVVTQVFRYALDREMIHVDPTHRVSMPRGWKAGDAWTFLTMGELRAILGNEDIPVRDRAIVSFLVGTGLRRWEWLALHLPDVRPDGIVIRFGSENDGPTKNRKTRVLPWMPLAARGWAVWTALVMPTHTKRNKLDLAFPGPLGGYYGKWFDRVWRTVLEKAGITRRVRPHDLRHTAASALISGYFGKPPTMIEVRDFLGHSSLKQTERYAHLAEGHLDRMALESVDTLGQLLPQVGHATNESALLADTSDGRQCNGGLDRRSSYAVVIVDDFEDVRPTRVGHEALVDLEIASTWTPWGPRPPQLIGDPPDMTGQLRAAEGWA